MPVCGDKWGRKACLCKAHCECNHVVERDGKTSLKKITIQIHHWKAHAKLATLNAPTLVAKAALDASRSTTATLVKTLGVMRVVTLLMALHVIENTLSFRSVRRPFGLSLYFVPVCGDKTGSAHVFSAPVCSWSVRCAVLKP